MRMETVLCLQSRFWPLVPVTIQRGNINDFELLDLGLTRDSFLSTFSEGFLVCVALVQVVRVSRNWNFQQTLKISVQLIFFRKFCYLTNFCGWQAWNKCSTFIVGHDFLLHIRIILVINQHPLRPIKACPRHIVVTTLAMGKKLRLH